MPAIWTAPRSWSVGELVTAALLNAHLRDNLDFLKTPPTASYILNESADYTTTSTSFVSVDNTKLSLAITTAGGDVLVGFSGVITGSTNLNAFFDVEVDGVRIAGDDGLIVNGAASGGRYTVTFFRLITGLSAGVHTFKLQWRTSTGTLTLYAGAGTGSGDVHPQFFVREVS
jgi:hypothetical protein